MSDGPLTQEELDNLSDNLGVMIRKASAKKRPSSIMLYGPAKVGKTRLAASIQEVPGFERVLILDTEGGTSTVAHAYPNCDVIDIVPKIETAAKGYNVDYNNAYAKFTHVLDALANGGLSEKYDAVVIDTLDVLQEAVREKFIDLQPDKKASFHVWGALNKWTIETMWILHRLPFLTIFNVHQRMDVDEATGRQVIFPMLESGARHKASSIPDIIGYLTVDKDGTRLLEVTPNRKSQSGNRFEHVLGGTLDDPTMAKIYRRLDG